MAVAMICGFCFVSVSCSNDDDDNKSGQLLEVYGVEGTKGKARLTVNGKVLFNNVEIWVGKNGIGKTSENDSKTPTGTLRPLSAFGIKPNPGTTMPYIDITPDIFACDENCEYYNKKSMSKRPNMIVKVKICTPISRTITMALLPTSTRSASGPMAATSSFM